MEFGVYKDHIKYTTSIPFVILHTKNAV